MLCNLSQRKIDFRGANRKEVGIITKQMQNDYVPDICHHHKFAFFQRKQPPTLHADPVTPVSEGVEDLHGRCQALPALGVHIMAEVQEEPAGGRLD